MRNLKYLWFITSIIVVICLVLFNSTSKNETTIKAETTSAKANKTSTNSSQFLATKRSLIDEQYVNSQLQLDSFKSQLVKNTISQGIKPSELQPFLPEQKTNVKPKTQHIT